MIPANISIVARSRGSSMSRSRLTSYLPVTENAPNLINMAIMLHPIAQLTAEVLASSASVVLLGGAGKVILTLPFLCFDSAN